MLLEPKRRLDAGASLSAFRTRALIDGVSLELSIDSDWIENCVTRSDEVPAERPP